MKNALGIGKNAVTGPSQTPIVSGPVAGLKQRGNNGDMRSGIETALGQHADALHPRRKNVMPTSPDRAPSTKY